MSAILEVNGLVKYFPVKEGLFGKVKKWVHAVDGVDLNCRRRETFGLVGESGSGKTTVGRCILRLIEPTSGKICFDGKELLQLKSAELLEVRRNMSMVFQDPNASLNPRMIIRDIIGEPLTISKKAKGRERDKKVADLLERVGMDRQHMRRYAHEFSGGQRQRIAIARALALNPKFVVLDEPTSALDVSVQAKILNLLVDLQDEFDLSYLFISHNLDVVKYLSDRIGVMYVGKLLEVGSTGDVYGSPLHPYTKALLSANPIPDPEICKKEIMMVGEIPSAMDPPPGCRFHTRCSHPQDQCKKKEPHLIEVGHGHFVSCHTIRKNL